LLALTSIASLRRCWFVALLATCLVLSQALWLLHRVAHVGIATHAGAAHGPAATQAVSPSQVNSLWAKSLLPDHQDERSCAQYDQLGHADLALGCEPLQVSQALMPNAQPAHVASLMAAQAAGFLARGPPATV
jgi:hypothetical protein